jgi:hypothetical protein
LIRTFLQNIFAKITKHPLWQMAERLFSLETVQDGVGVCHPYCTAALCHQNSGERENEIG